ncbi:uncharacterized protein LOC122933247 isoform X2 [Bufo gargarizans]|uniref:uncharacterized protein LOC122933247 isoform X2 n=1 Tax=Bufo gargarizans TaxID=30331 RepID=UPI001CF166AF|nr:uncharacterized protein LOC122933247 isoform X2 [Bufo gargarizans]
MDFSRTLFYVAGIIATLCSCSIADYPPSPTFTVIPLQPSYDKGQEITMICAPPNNTNAKGIRYYRNFTEIQCDKQMEKLTHCHIVISKKENEGVYNCGYWVIINGTERLSYGSDVVNIMIGADTTTSWIYYTAGGIVVFAVCFISCLLYKRSQKRKSSQKVLGTHVIYRNPGDGKCKEPVKNFPLPVGQSHLNNPLYSVICQIPTLENKQLLSGDENTKMTTALKGSALESFKKSTASAEDFSQAREESYIYSEIGTEISPNNYQHPSTNAKSFSLEENVTIYYTVQVPPLPRVG